MDSQLCIFTLFLWNLGYQESHRTYFFVLFLFPFLCSSCNITLIISTVKRWVLIILWRFCEALILRASQGFFTYFRTRFSWFDHIFTTNSWKNIFVWFSYHILRQRLMVYTTAGTVSGRFILDISFSTWDFSAIWL